MLLLEIRTELCQPHRPIIYSSDLAIVAFPPTTMPAVPPQPNDPAIIPPPNPANPPTSDDLFLAFVFNENVMASMRTYIYK